MSTWEAERLLGERGYKLNFNREWVMPTNHPQILEDEYEAVLTLISQGSHKGIV